MWVEAGDDVVAFTHQPDFACVVNLGTEPAESPIDGRVELSSRPLTAGALIPGDTAV